MDLFCINMIKVRCMHALMNNFIWLFDTSQCYKLKYWYISMFYREKYAELDCDIDGDCKGVQSKDVKTNADTEKTWSKCSRWVLQSSWS